jgi:prepilin-type N-terminal cleavage/methylation domain-containing protein/prepilin-type processing-associated H-X9-DG protein
MRNKKAFTLIELLVVIAIIAILAAILFPVFAQAREKARAIACVSNEKQISLGVLMYVQDYDEIFPLSQYNLPDGTGVLWQNIIYPYIKNGDHQGSESISGNYDVTMGTSGVWQCPDYPFPAQGSSYGVNLLMMPILSFIPNTNLHPLLCSMAQIESPSDMVMVMELGVNDGGGTYNIFDPEEDYWTTTAGNPPGSHFDDLDEGFNSVDDIPTNCDATAAQINANGYTYAGCGMMPRFRHQNQCNMAFTDGHVKPVMKGRLNWYNNIYIQGLYEKTYTWMPPVY